MRASFIFYHQFLRGDNNEQIRFNSSSEIYKNYYGET